MAVSLPMQAHPTMLFHLVDFIFVGVHTAEGPRVDEWRRYCAVAEEVGAKRRGALIYTLGGGPDSRQREELRVALHGLPPPPTAILTNSPLVRGIITSMNWYFGGQQVAAFAPSNLDAALDHLERDGKTLPRDAIVRELVSLARQIGVEPPATGSTASRASHG